MSKVCRILGAMLHADDQKWLPAVLSNPESTLTRSNPTSVRDLYSLFTDF